MKKLLRFLMLSVLFLPFALQAQTTVEIGDLSSATDNSYLPMNSLYEYSYTQQIYTSDEIGMAGTITSITMWLYGNENLYEMPFNIYMLEVSTEEFLTTGSWIPVTASDIVYSGSVTVHNATDSAYTFVLDVPFEYSGTENLLICFDNNTGQWKSGLNGMVFTADDNLKRAIYARRDGTTYDPTNMTGITATAITALRNVVAIGITPSGGSICEKPSTFASSGVTAHEATLTWTSTAAGNYQLEYKTAADSIWEEISVTGDTTYPLNNLISNTAYNARVKAICGVDFESGYRNVNFTTLISCPAPTGLDVILDPSDPTSAALSWTENGTATDWQIVLNDDEDNIIDANTNPYPLTNLTPDFIYTAKVRAYCDVDDQSTWSNTISFEPTTKIVIGSGNSTNNNLPTNCYYKYSLSQQIYTVAELGDAGLIESIDFYNNSTSARTRDLSVYLISTPKNAFDSTTDWISVSNANLQYSGSITFAPHAWTTINLDGFVYDGTNNVAIIIDDNSGSYSSNTPFLTFSASQQALGVHNDGTNYDVNAPTYTGTIETTKNQIRIAKSELGSCLKPSGVTVSYTGGDEATVTWNSEETNFNISVNGDVTYNVTSPYTLTGLDLATTYTVSVQTVCSGSSISEWTNPISFTTDLCLPEDQCNIYIYAEDSYGDGWNGATINVMQNGVSVGNYSMASQNVSSTRIYDTATVNVCSNFPISFVWTKGQWDSEITLSIANANGDVVFTAAGSELANGSTFFGMEGCSATIATDTIETIETACDSYIWTNGTTYTQSGNYSYEVFDTTGHHIYTLDLTINHSVQSIFNVVVSESSYDWNGVILTESGIYYDTLVAANGCDSVLILNLSISANPITEYPYSNGFEEGDDMGWQFANDANAWVIGTDNSAVNAGNHALYISNDSNTYAYTITSSSWSYAYRLMQVSDLGQYNFSFDWKANGEGTWDYLRAWVAPGVVNPTNGANPIGSTGAYSSATPNGWMDLNPNGGKLNLSTNWNNIENSYILEPGYYTIVFMWRNDGTQGEQPPASIDNFAIGVTNCLPVSAITVDDANENSVTISWIGNAANYDLYQDGDYVTTVTTESYTFTGLTTSTAYTFGVQAICSATDSAEMTTIDASTTCPDVTVLPYNEGFENGLGCWITINASSDGQPWTANNCSGLSTVDPHGGAYVASSWSWSGSAMHADAWLISPKFVLPNTTDSLSFSWWDITNAGYPDSYTVVLSTTTIDPAAFTTVLRPYGPATGSWTMQTVDLTAYAGQSVYIAFHHTDYNENYLLIDDIALYEGAYIPPAPDTLTVTFAVNDATMGTTVPAPGSYQYFMGDTVAFHPEANPGYHFTNWVMSAGGQSDTLAANYVSVYFIVNGQLMSYGTVTMTALFEADSTPVTESLTINLTINDPTLGSITPAPGIYVVALNDSLVLSATPNAGINFDGWRVIIGGQTLATVPANPFTLPVTPGNIGFVELTIMAMFSDSTSAPDSMTIIINTADATMGTTNPAPGTYNFAVGSQSFVTAVPNNGYHLLYWIESFEIGGMSVSDTLHADTIIVTVQPIMAGMVSSLTAYFAPGDPCAVPTGLHTTNIESNAISIAWDADAAVNSWNIQYRVAGTTAWSSATANTNSYTISGLQGSTTYEIQIQANCGDGNLSDWSASITVTTTGIANWLENSVVLFPNPAREYIDIRIDGDVNVSMMEVYDVYGKLISNVNVVENPTRINVSGLANGMYFVRVTTEQGVVTKSFIKK